MTTWTACWTSASGSCCPRWCWCENQGEREPHSKRGDLAHKNGGSTSQKKWFSQQKWRFKSSNMWYLANKNCVLTKSVDFSYASKKTVGISIVLFPHWDRFGHAEPLPHGFPCPQHRFAARTRLWSTKWSNTIGLRNFLRPSSLADVLVMPSLAEEWDFWGIFRWISMDLNLRQQKWSKLKHILS